MNNPLLAGKVAFVTGAGAGIGRATAVLFAENGAHVYALDIDRDAAESVARQTMGHGFEADVRRTEAIQTVVADAFERYGRIDVLVNNAGIYPRRVFLEMTESEWDDVLDVNLKGTFRCARLVAPGMVAQRYGKIINISSVNAFRGGIPFAHYTAAKAGQIGFTRSLARELGPHNVYVNCITPGAVETEGEKQIAKPGEIEALVAQQSLCRRIQPLDVARVCLFLASELSDGMTGQTINVDGGRILH